MLPYTKEYKESEYDIQNNDLLYKTNQKHQNTFYILEKWYFWKEKTKNQSFQICILYFV